MNPPGTLGKNGGGFMIHVWGLPEDGGVGLDEVLCSTPQTDATVIVWHEGAKRTAQGEWTCSTCGETTEERGRLAS